MNIDGLGIKIVELLLAKNIINNFSDLYYLKKEDINNLDRMGDKSAENIISAIETSKLSSLSNFIHGLGIRNVGHNASKILEKNFDLESLMHANKDKLISIPEIGDIMANSIVNFFNNQGNIDLINKCIKGGLKFRKVDKISKTLIFGKTFVFTGTLNTTNRNDAKKIIESFGAKSSSSVSKNTDYVIAGKGAGSKIKKAKDLGLKILNEESFQDLINKLK